ncbi:MAG: DUF748 domain-containing protein [Candidatus Omnitrophota bacterium]|nr:DUF748 domain-containing protein [Candidatus Omnitrophota bacterium]
MALKSLFNKKIFINTLLTLIVLIILIHLGIFVFLNLKGKDILKEAIKKNLGMDAQVEALSFRFPFTVVIKNFKCADVSFKNAYISLGLFNPFTSYLSFNRIYFDGFNFVIRKDKNKFSLSPIFIREDNAAEVTQGETATPSAPASVPSVKSSKKISLEIGKLYFKDGSGEIIDSTKDTPITYVLKNVSFELKHFIYPQLTKFYVRLNASLEKSGTKMDDIVAVRGWVDYFKKNMDMDININNVDYLAFSEYYPPFWKPDNLGVKAAQFSFTSKFNSKNNDLVIDGVLSLDKIDFVEQIEENSNAKLIRTMIAFYKGDREKATLPIRLKTKMDSLKLDFSSIQLDFQDKIKIGPIVFIQKAIDKTKDVISEKAKEVGEGAKGTKEITVDKIIGIIGDVVDTVKGVIKKSKEEELKSNMAGAKGSVTQDASQTQLEEGALSEANAPVQNAIMQKQEEATRVSNQNQAVTEPQESQQPQNNIPPQDNTQSQNNAVVPENTQTQSNTQNQNNTQTQQNAPTQENLVPQ